MFRQLLKEEVEKEQEQVNSLQNMVVVVDETNENNSDEGNYSQLLLVSEWVCSFLTAHQHKKAI